ncbi:hypothetical protein TCON_2623, partial [Astathelohania contejeani]
MENKNKTSEDITLSPPSGIKNQPRKRKLRAPKELGSYFMIINQNQDDEKYMITYHSPIARKKSVDDTVKKLDEIFQVFKESQQEKSKYNIIPIKQGNRPLDNGEYIFIIFQKPPFKKPPSPSPSIPKNYDDDEDKAEAKMMKDRQFLKYLLKQHELSLLTPGLDPQEKEMIKEQVFSHKIFLEAYPSSSSSEDITLSPPSDIKNQPRKKKLRVPKELDSCFMIINQNQDDEKYMITYNSPIERLKSVDDTVKKLDEIFQVFKESQQEKSKYNIIPIKQGNRPLDNGEYIFIIFQKPPFQKPPSPSPSIDDYHYYDN